LFNHLKMEEGDEIVVFNDFVYISSPVNVDTLCEHQYASWGGRTHICNRRATICVENVTRDTKRYVCIVHFKEMLFEGINPFLHKEEVRKLKACPKQVIYRIGEKILQLKYSIHDGEWFRFYHRRVDKYVNRCICLLWKIPLLYRDLRILIAKLLWKDRIEWVKLVDLP